MSLLTAVLLRGGGAGIVTLSGTPSAPNVIEGNAGQGTSATWTFGADGIVYSGGSAFDAGTEWNSLQGTLDPIPRPFYLRATSNAGMDPNGQGVMDTWLALSGPDGQARSFTWVSGGGVVTGSIKIEIGLGPSGPAIETGYYGANLD